MSDGWIRRESLEVHPVGGECFAAGFGRPFVNYYLHTQQAELARFEAGVTEWENREYFEMF